MSKRLLFLLLILSGCHYNRPDEQQLVKELIKTDQDFSLMSRQKGRNEAFLFYAADSVVMPAEGKLPLFGKPALARQFEGAPDDSIRLQWKPLRAEASGDLGYTFGQWQLRRKGVDSVQYGTYVTVWKKFPDGRWKYILDCGQSTPKPN
jgi:ketosteroid isomerase-like protein